MSIHDNKLSYISMKSSCTILSPTVVDTFSWFLDAFGYWITNEDNSKSRKGTPQETMEAQFW